MIFLLSYVSDTLEFGVIRWYFNFIFVRYDCKEELAYIIKFLSG